MCISGRNKICTLSFAKSSAAYSKSFAQHVNISEPFDCNIVTVERDKNTADLRNGICIELGLAVCCLLESKQDLQSFKIKIMDVLRFTEQELQVYYKKKDFANGCPAQYCSMILNGACQSVPFFSRFVMRTKNDRGVAFLVRLVKLLWHNYPLKPSLFTLTKEYESTASYVVKVLHLLFIAKARFCLLAGT